MEYYSVAQSPASSLLALYALEAGDCQRSARHVHRISTCFNQTKALSLPWSALRCCRLEIRRIEKSPFIFVSFIGELQPRCDNHRASTLPYITVHLHDVPAFVGTKTRLFHPAAGTCSTRQRFAEIGTTLPRARHLFALSPRCFQNCFWKSQGFRFERANPTAPTGSGI